MTPAPRLEVSGDRVKQSGLRRRLFLHRGTAEEARAQPSVPTDIVPTPHLIFEEPREQQALRPRGFQHQTVVQQSLIDYEIVEDRTQISRNRQVDVGRCRDLREMCENAGVVEQFLSIVSRL